MLLLQLILTSLSSLLSSSSSPSPSPLSSLLLLLLAELTTAIRYQCNDDQILTVQNFGNDTIRMLCQKPNLCGHQNLKCHYEPLKLYCGGKTNFVTQVEQMTPVGPVIHTCCDLKQNENESTLTYVGNDCFRYDLPDGTNKTVAEEVEREDQEGYMRLKNLNKFPEQFSNYSGYRLRLYMIRNKESLQLVVKGIERTEVGYRVTICRTECQQNAKQTEKSERNGKSLPFKIFNNGININKDDLKKAEIIVHNLTDNGEWIFAAWTEWSYKEWSQWSRIQWTEFDNLGRTNLRGHRHRTTLARGNEGPVADKGHKGRDDHKQTKIEGNGQEGKFRVPVSQKIAVDMSEIGSEISFDEQKPKETGLDDVTISSHPGHGRKDDDSSDCNDDEYYDNEEEDRNEIGYEEGRKGQHHEKVVGITDEEGSEKLSSVVSKKQELKTNSTDKEKGEEFIAIESGKVNKEEKSSTEKKFLGDKKGIDDNDINIRHMSTKSNMKTDIPEAKRDDKRGSKTFITGQERTNEETDNSKAKEDSEARGEEENKMEESTTKKPRPFERQKYPASDTRTTEFIVRNVTSRPEEFIAKETITKDSDSSSNETSTNKLRKELEAPKEKKAENKISVLKRKGADTSSRNTVRQISSTRKVVQFGSKEMFAATTLRGPKFSEMSTQAAITRRRPVEIDCCKLQKNTMKGKTSTESNSNLRPNAFAAKRVSAKDTVSVGPIQRIGGVNKTGGRDTDSKVNAAIGSDRHAKAYAAANANDAQFLADSSMNCFSADTKVYTPQGEITMKELKVGDSVLVPISKSQLRFERVEMFYHREPEKRAKFVILETESGRKLSLTELHLLPLGNCQEMHQSITDVDMINEWLRKSKFAYKARVGDCVFSIASSSEVQVDRILKVSRHYLKGIYSPMTVEGSIITDGILASCFSQVESHFTQKLVYDFLISMRQIFGQMMQAVDEPIQHLPTFIHSLHHLSRHFVPFIKY